MLAFLLTLGLLLAGCSDNTKTPAKEEDGMRGALQDKGTFDINKVPEKDRDKVRAMMGKAPSASSQGAGSTP